MTEQRAWREVTIPAFEMLMLCCSIASWMLTLECWDILKRECRKTPADIYSTHNRLPVLIIHFIELINKTYPSIGQNKCPSFKGPLSCDRVLMHCCCEAYSRGPFSSCINSPLSCLFNIPNRILRGHYKTEWSDKASHSGITLTWGTGTWQCLDHPSGVHLCLHVIGVSPPHFSPGLQTLLELLQSLCPRDHRLMGPWT